ncbi:NAD(P)/FAD-dependent oxidoreductase [Pseudoalteromonas sp. ASV78]|uniref:NAD(P)/FAD-dependent oxidoreductase n=1 Tax=Pseudoalteromonas sp. ASV78 TaxID=3397851 RepID=UPI0039FCC40E
MARCIIIGGGHAAAEAAFNLRKNGWQGEIILFSAEQSLPYHRPPLSKQYLSGKIVAQQLQIKPQAAYDKAHIDLQLGCKVKTISPTLKSIECLNGDVWQYDKLLLCTGSQVRKLTIPGSDLRQVFYIKTIGDIERIAEQLQNQRSKKVVMIGGGYIGLETAAVLRTLAHQVTIIEQNPRILERVAAPPLANFISQLHQQRGVNIVTNTQITALSGSNKVEHVHCSNGQQFAADLVIVGIGATANVQLAYDAGLLVEQGGIVVDQHCQTTDPNIFAAGDCTLAIEPFSGHATRIESVPNAISQAKIAAAVICAVPPPKPPVPWFWSDQYDCKIQLAGLNFGYDELIVEHNEAQQLTVWYYKEQQLIAADCVNNVKNFMQAKKILAQPAIIKATSQPQ